MTVHAFRCQDDCVQAFKDYARGRRKSSWGSCGNISFRDGSFYSYAAEIACIVVNKHGAHRICTSTDNWSMTTSRHQFLLRGHDSLSMQHLHEPGASRDAEVEAWIGKILTARNGRSWWWWSPIGIKDYLAEDRAIRDIEEFFGLKPVVLPEYSITHEVDDRGVIRRSLTFQGKTSYFFNRARVPKWLWHGKITPKRVLGTTNAEVRRRGMEIYGGWPGFIAAMPDAEKVHTDDFGELWRLPVSSVAGGCIMIVKVVNSTADPVTGKYVDYFLRVHPELRPLLDHQRRVNGNPDLLDGDPRRWTHWTQLGEPQAMTARNAVASTFGLTGDKYGIVEES